MGEGNQEGCDAVVHQGTLLLFLALVNVLGGVASVAINTKDEQEHTAAYLEQEFVLGVADEVHDKAHAQSGEERIDNVAHHGTYAGHKAVPTAFVQRALYAEHAYRSHWGRSEYTDKQAFDDKI